MMISKGKIWHYLRMQITMDRDTGGQWFTFHLESERPRGGTNQQAVDIFKELYRKYLEYRKELVDARENDDTIVIKNDGDQSDAYQ